MTVDTRTYSECEDRLIATMGAMEISALDLQKNLQALEHWREQLRADLSAAPLRHAGLRADSGLARQTQAINDDVVNHIQHWQQQWVDLGEAHAVADVFHDQAVLLVFGKFNAGKSSLCNFLAERFRSAGQRLQYFHVEGGHVHESHEADACFKEGATETTARLQGVRLGERLVLLDSPGLHSATEQNASLTQRFIDSADGVLWLSSSTSPGQVQELDELARELHRHKPLQPIITRSDFIEEDEVDGEIRKVLRNKTDQNRTLQEADVTERARAKLQQMHVDPTLLQPPVSVSVHATRAQQQTPKALADGGFERLYAALLCLTDPVLTYKRRKPAEVLLHHLDERVMGDVNARLKPSLQALHTALEAAEAALDDDLNGLTKAVWRGLAPQLPQWLDWHEKGADVAQIGQEAAHALEQAFNQTAHQALADYAYSPLDSARFTIDISSDGEGATPNNAIMANPEQLYATLEHAMLTRLQEAAAVARQPCEVALLAMKTRILALLDDLQVYAKALEQIKHQLRRH